MGKTINSRPRKSKLPKLIEQYYADMAELAHQHVMFEMGTRPAFHALLAAAGKEHGWTLIAEHAKKVNGRTIRPDGTFKDGMNLVRGYWEAKDTDDKLEVEIEKKRKAGYPLTNIIFEDNATAILYQHGQECLRADMKDPARLGEVVAEFFRYVEPEIEEFEQAVDEFKERVPDLAEGLAKKIEQAHRANPAFKRAFADFFELCKSSLNPNLSQPAVDEMLIQHILTERLIREIFDNPEFVRRNVIAAEVEKVMLAMTSQSFDRHSYLKELDRFYVAIERAARTMTDWSDKQYFLNTVYERFFQGYSVKLADTMGIVYTPQEIVDFMCASVAEVLEKEFGKKLWSDDVYIIDPCTGTGNFIVNLIRRMPKAKLPDVYKHRLFANEIMLLPYYIAALNIEHAYYEQTGNYEGFEGLCFVDTLDLAEHGQGQLGFMTAGNTARVERQRKTPITVIIGNPPYNSHQQDENDNNKNRNYPALEKMIRATYGRGSRATNTNKLRDPYVTFFRWAVDRLGDRDGVVCFVTNNSFVKKTAFDAMRREFEQDFTCIYHVDLHGDVQLNPKLSGTTHNVFGIKIGVGITVAVRKRGGTGAQIAYSRVEEGWRRDAKLAWLSEQRSVSGVKWSMLAPDSAHAWLVPENADEFARFMAVGSKEAKASRAATADTIFKSYCIGLVTNRDDVVYDFRRDPLADRTRRFVEDYNAEVFRYQQAGGQADVDSFVRYERIKWSRDLKRDLARGRFAQFDAAKLRPAMYRPFVRKWLFFDSILNQDIVRWPTFLPAGPAALGNLLIGLTDLGAEKPFVAMALRDPTDLHFVGSGCATQCFPFYTYDEDGTNRRENITDWALDQFREQYKDKMIDKWSIFHYVYGMLHHPGYREKFADNLKRELPRIPFAPASAASALTGGEGGGGVSPLVQRRDAAATLPAPPASAASALTGGGLEDADSAGGGTGGGRPPVGALAARGADSAGGGAGGTGGFWAFAEAGKALAALHLDYEKLEPWPLEMVETPDVPLSYRVEDKMRLSKDKTRLCVNPSLALEGIPPEVYAYRLGNRSALEWVIDQYQVCTDARSGIVSDPNREDDPQYIVRLVGQVARVSIETMKIVNALPAEHAERAENAE